MEVVAVAVAVVVLEELKVELTNLKFLFFGFFFKKIISTRVHVLEKFHQKSQGLYVCVYVTKYVHMYTT